MGRSIWRRPTTLATSSGLSPALSRRGWPSQRPYCDLPASSPPGSPARSAGAREGPRTPTGRWFAVLFVSYSLEGVGYIIAGTFLVAAIGQSSPGWIGGGAWVLVGLAAVPSAAMWAWLGRRFCLPDLLVASLAIQAVGIALPALVGGVGAALISAFLFGGTFLGVATLALAAGAQLRFPRSVALLTAGYSVGQILGPLGVTPFVHHRLPPGPDPGRGRGPGRGPGRRRASHRLPASHAERLVGHRPSGGPHRSVWPITTLPSSVRSVSGESTGSAGAAAVMSLVSARC